MPTLDGIVVTEPKETEVYTFNKNDIKKIAKESIEQADAIDLNKNGTFRAFENIVDKDGHPRFIEGDIDLVDTLDSGITKTYGKWALCGTHLLIVLGADFADTSIIGGGSQFSKGLNLPSWVEDKIEPLFATYIVELKPISIFADNYSSQSCNFMLYKHPTVGLCIYSASAVTLTANRHGRIAFDLLIDNE